MGSINLPGVRYNAAANEAGHASSFYDYQSNPQFEYKYIPGNANDGNVYTSWWSSGILNENAYWQLNFTHPPKSIDKIVIRWHGFQSAKNYRVRTAFGDQVFRTMVKVVNKSVAWDRNDEIEGKPTDIVRFLRIQMDDANFCESNMTCDGRSTSEDYARVVYGIREVEVWSSGFKSGTWYIHIFFSNST